MAWPNITLPPYSFGSVYESADWQSQYLLKELVAKKVDIFGQQMPGLFPKLGTMEDDSSLKPRWMHGEEYPTDFVADLTGGNTLTVTSKLFGLAASRAMLLNICRVGTVLEHVSNGTHYQVRVTAVDSTDPIMTIEATGGTSVPSNATDMDWTRISSPYKESIAAPDPVMAGRDLLYTGSQLFTGSIGLEESRIQISMMNGIDEWEYQMDRMLKDLQKQVAYAAIRGIPAMSDAGVPLTHRETNEPRLFGLFWWMDYLFGSGGQFENLKLVVNQGGKPIYEEDIEALALAMFENGTPMDQKNIQIWAHHEITDHMNKFGLSKRRQSMDSKTAGQSVTEIIVGRRAKPIPINADPTFPKGALMMLDMDAPKHGYVTGNHLRKERRPTANMWFKQDQWGMQKTGLKINGSKTFGAKIENINVNG